MLYPVMPIYLQTIGFTFVWIGILEGFAEGVAGLLRGTAGQMSDHLDNRTGFVRTGYALSSISKPMLAFLAHPVWIFAARAIDRTGKGLRSAPRDALLALESAPEHRARVFGFHRGMDTAGAVLGPLASLGILYFMPGEYRTLFLIAFLPALAGVILTFLVRDKKTRPETGQKPVSLNPFHYLSYFKTAPRNYKMLAGGIAGFSLINSSDVFLILMMKQRGLSDQDALLAYIFYNCVFAAAAFPAGALADRFGLKRTFLAGLILFACVYGGMTLDGNRVWFFGLLSLYGIYAAATEGIGKAWITRTVKKEDAGTAVGAATSLQSLGAIAASTLAGVVWQAFGAPALFLCTTAGALLAAVYFLWQVEE